MRAILPSPGGVRTHLAAPSVGSLSYSTLAGGLRGPRRGRFSGVPSCEGHASLRREIGPCFPGRGNITELNNSVMFRGAPRDSDWNGNGRTLARARTASPFAARRSSSLRGTSSDQSSMTLRSPWQIPMSVLAVAVALDGSLDIERWISAFAERRSGALAPRCLDILRSVSPRPRVAAPARCSEGRASVRPAALTALKRVAPFSTEQKGIPSNPAKYVRALFPESSLGRSATRG